jgi:hypothetical protein
MGTVHSLADARRRRFRPSHETIRLEETAAIVGKYFQDYLEGIKELEAAKAALRDRKEKIKGWLGWFRAISTRPTTNELQLSVDCWAIRANFRYREYREAKEEFDYQKNRFDCRMESMGIYRKPEFLPVDPPR